MTANNSPVPEDLLNLFQPDKDALLKWLSERADDQMLSLAATCHDNQAYAKHFAILKQIRITLLVPSPLENAFQDLLCSNLCESPDVFIDDRPGYPGHVTQAFACTILLIAVAEDTRGWSFSTFVEPKILLQLIESAQVLEIMPLALGFLAWRVLDANIDEKHWPLFALSILFLAILSKADGKTLNRLAEWVMQEEAILREKSSLIYYGTNIPLASPWLFDLTDCDLYKKQWQDFGRKLLLDPSSPHPAEAELSLRLIGSTLTGEDA